ncbi:MAG: aspartate--tRNA(Asn) ligase [Candidatus Moranbacteria bacterium RIFCSPHIGHO2_01_FULL_55_24]|nr:MAG: aspartate--tRNA(Asn) ligase [Candidatus Moranbacteria bacterium RIFCSPHIGHO2_01_FULL_55_24]
MERVLIKDAPKHIGEVVKLCGWVNVRRDHGKLVFLELRDRTGTVQAIILPDAPEAIEAAHDVRPQFSLMVEGLVKERPGKAQNVEQTTGNIEIEVKSLSVLAAPSVELPIDVSQTEMGLQLDTLLNYRTLALRNAKIGAIFQIYSELLAAYESAMRSAGFLEIKTPKILEAATEGGANFFKIDYFERVAFLAQSPQFYKQAGMSAFERVFEIGTVFRAEPHFTTRHVNEYTGFDAEMGFIESMEDVMAALEEAMFAMFEHIGKTCQEALALHEASVPERMAIPRIRLTEALEILKAEYGKEVEDQDIDSEGERLICEYVKKKYGSDLVFLTHYPTHLRPFYSMPSPEDPAYTETYDLLFRGVEIASGGQRIHDPKMLEEQIRNKGLNPDDFKDYVDIFRFGTPPHGGWGLGSERIIQRILDLGSIKEAVLYPRDVKRLAP